MQLFKFFFLVIIFYLFTKSGNKKLKKNYFAELCKRKKKR